MASTPTPTPTPLLACPIAIPTIINTSSVGKFTSALYNLNLPMTLNSYDCQLDTMVVKLPSTKQILTVADTSVIPKCGDYVWTKVTKTAVNGIPVKSSPFYPMCFIGSEKSTTSKMLPWGHQKALSTMKLGEVSKHLFSGDECSTFGGADKGLSSCEYQIQFGGHYNRTIGMSSSYVPAAPQTQSRIISNWHYQRKLFFFFDWGYYTILIMSIFAPQNLSYQTFIGTTLPPTRSNIPTLAKTTILPPRNFFVDIEWDLPRKLLQGCDHAQDEDGAPCVVFVESNVNLDESTVEPQDSFHHIELTEEMEEYLVSVNGMVDWSIFGANVDGSKVGEVKDEESDDESTVEPQSSIQQVEIDDDILLQLQIADEEAYFLNILKQSRLDTTKNIVVPKLPKLFFDKSGVASGGRNLEAVELQHIGNGYLMGANGHVNTIDADVPRFKTLSGEKLRGSERSLKGHLGGLKTPYGCDIDTEKEVKNEKKDSYNCYWGIYGTTNPYACVDVYCASKTELNPTVSKALRLNMNTVPKLSGSLKRTNVLGAPAYINWSDYYNMWY